MKELDAEPPLFPPPSHPLRLGVIGLGGIAQGSHLPCIALLRRWGWPVQVVSVADPDPRRIAQTRFENVASDVNQIAQYPDGETLLAAGGVDAVLILTPPSVTTPLLHRVLSGTIPALAEKPVATDAETLAKLVDAERTRGSDAPIVRVGYNRRSQPLAAPFRDAVQSLRAADANGVLHVEARLWRAERQDRIYYEDTMVHALDFLLWTVGPLALKQVDRWPAGPNDDLSAGLRVQMETEGAPNAPPVSVHLDVRPAVGRDTETYTALGASASVELAYPLHVLGTEQARLTRYQAGRAADILAPGSASRADDPEGLMVRGFLPQLASFLYEVAGEGTPEGMPELCRLEGALRTAQLRRAVLKTLE